MKLIREKLGDFAELTGYLHEPDQEMGNIRKFPVMLVLPGGGFRICSSREAEPIASAYYAEGYSAFVLDYTTVTKKPEAVMADPMKDVQDALNWIHNHGEDCCLNTDRIAMIGFSGGGHLAAASATHDPLRPNALVLIYPGITHNPTRALDCPDIIDSVDEQTPPSFIVGTRADTVTPPRHQLAFASALEKVSVDFELHIFPGGVHGMSLGKSLTCSGNASYIDSEYAQWFPMSVRWLKNKLGDFTIYGVNDGRNGRFHIDRPMAELFADEQASAIVSRYLPMASQLKDSPFAGDMTLRNLSKFLPGLTEETLEELDRELLKL